MSRFPPKPSVLRTVKMTRTAYAQLVGQKFHPPKIFGRLQEKEGTKEWRWRDIGMKVVSRPSGLSTKVNLTVICRRPAVSRCSSRRAKAAQTYRATLPMLSNHR